MRRLESATLTWDSWLNAKIAECEEKERRAFKMFDRKWKRWRFYARSIDDYRPLIFNPAYPWWRSATGNDFVVIVAYLPADEPLERYWPDAFNAEYTEEETITFTDRFPKPEYYVDG